jgi:DNA-binding YbaB/EbfC family protein
VDVWYDEHNMESGKLMEVVERELRARPVFVVILSPAALASKWVSDESSWAYQLYKSDPTRIILPVLVEPVKEDEIWLWLRDFRRIETSGLTPFPEDERIRRTLRVLRLTPAAEPEESMDELLPHSAEAVLGDPDSFDDWSNSGFNIKALQQMQNKLLKMQEELQNTLFEGTAGGGAVTVSITGKFDVTGIRIVPEVVDPEDLPLLEDLILAASQDAFSKATEAQQKMMTSISSGMGLPPGISF